MYAMKPKFLRCPGGNNIEGESIQQRLKWWETIGPLKDRPGRIGDWGYYNTDGLGLMEYMAWCEDMEMEPVLAVYAGYSLDGTSYPEQYMDEVLQEILDELEFLLGNTTSKWGSKRAEYGHPEPYVINNVEVGNEDFFSCTYPYRWPYLYSHLKSAYPDIRFISTAFRENQAGGYNSRCNWTVELPSGSGDDVHNYQTPSFYLNNFDIFDNFANNSLDDVEILLGEYSVFQLDTFSQFVNFSDPPGIHPEYPQVIHALGEGVYQLAAERNPGLVTLSAYAPSLQNRNKYVWTPNMISFEAQYNQTVLTTSYWQQWLFSQYRGSHTVPVSGEINPLYWVGTIDNSTGVMYLKVMNTGNQTVALDIQFDTSYTSVNATTLQNDDPNAYNWITNQTAVVPRALNGTALPQMGAGNDTSSPFSNATSSVGVPSPMDTPSAMNASSSMNTTAASNSTMAFVTRDDAGASGGSVWSWTVPVFSSTVLQFNP